MFEGAVSSLLPCLCPSMQLAGLPSGHRVARFGWIFMFYPLRQEGWKQQQTVPCSPQPSRLSPSPVSMVVCRGRALCRSWSAAPGGHGCQAGSARSGKAPKRGWGCLVWGAEPPEPSRQGRTRGVWWG